MTNMSPLEKDVIARLLDHQFQQPSLTKDVLGKLVAKSREFSQDALDGTKCAGFYLNFIENDILKDAGELPRQVALHANCDELPTGAEFLLFFRSAGGVDFLEASFYGDALDKSELLRGAYCFKFQG